MAVMLNRKVDRMLGVTHRGLRLVARMCQEGVYLKGQGQRWSSAYLIPWAAAYDVAVKMAVVDARRAKAARRAA
jgi:hypothetical protein